MTIEKLRYLSPILFSKKNRRMTLPNQVTIDLNEWETTIQPCLSFGEYSIQRHGSSKINSKPVGIIPTSIIHDFDENIIIIIGLNWSS